MDAWGPGEAASFCGFHECELCRDDQVRLLSQRGDRYVRANGQLYIPTAESVYIAPLMIVHFVGEHSYRPPEEFMAALLECPAQGSADYLALIGRFRTNAFDDLEFDRSGDGVASPNSRQRGYGPNAACARAAGYGSIGMATRRWRPTAGSHL